MKKALWQSRVTLAILAYIIFCICAGLSLRTEYGQCDTDSNCERRFGRE